MALAIRACCNSTRLDRRSSKLNRATAFGGMFFFHQRNFTSKGDQVCSCAGFRMPACRDHPHARTAGVRKAPRHEIAGCGAPTVQRVLWGFGVGVSVGEVEPTLAIGSL